MEKRNLEYGDVVQLCPEYGNYGGMLLVVTNPMSFGCQGYVMCPNHFVAEKFNDKAILRVTWENMEYVGKLTWIECEDFLSKHSWKMVENEYISVA